MKRFTLKKTLILSGILTILALAVLISTMAVIEPTVTIKVATDRSTIFCNAIYEESPDSDNIYLLPPSDIIRMAIIAETSSPKSEYLGISDLKIVTRYENHYKMIKHKILAYDLITGYAKTEEIKTFTDRELDEWKIYDWEYDRSGKLTKRYVRTLDNNGTVIDETDDDLVYILESIDPITHEYNIPGSEHLYYTLRSAKSKNKPILLGFIKEYGYFPCTIKIKGKVSKITKKGKTSVKAGRFSTRIKVENF